MNASWKHKGVLVLGTFFFSTFDPKGQKECDKIAPSPLSHVQQAPSPYVGSVWKYRRIGGEVRLVLEGSKFIFVGVMVDEG